jgi:hypothetical protein
MPHRTSGYNDYRIMPISSIILYYDALRVTHADFPH